MEAENLIEYSSKYDSYDVKDIYSDMLYEKYIVTYDESLFWDELTFRLAERDLIEEIGEKAFQTMDIGERIKKLHAYETQYGNEFEKNYLDRLKISKDAQEDTV